MQSEARSAEKLLGIALLACLNRELDNLREIEPELSPGIVKRWWVEYS